MNIDPVMANFSTHYLLGYRGLTVTSAQLQLLQQTEEALTTFLREQPEGSRSAACVALDLSLTCDEEAVLDAVVRQWHASRTAGEPVHTDFGEHYTAVQWAALMLCLTRMTTLTMQLRVQCSVTHPIAPKVSGNPTADTLEPLMRLTKGIASRYNALRPFGRLLDDLEGTQAPSGFAFGRV